MRSPRPVLTAKPPRQVRSYNDLGVRISMSCRTVISANGSNLRVVESGNGSKHLAVLSMAAKNESNSTPAACSYRHTAAPPSHQRWPRNPHLNSSLVRFTRMTRKDSGSAYIQAGTSTG